MADESLATSRSRRQKADKLGKFAALKQLKEQRGGKHKASLDEVNNVYDLVDEKEYSKRVLNRQCDDWIVDEGSGYVEDGREIFDDDLDEESISKQSRGKSGGDRKRKSKHQDEGESSKGSGNIRHMLANMQPKKKKVEDVNIDNDELLGELMKDLDAKPLAPLPMRPVQRPKQPPPPLPAPKPVRQAVKESVPAVPVLIKEEPVEVPEVPASQCIEETDSMDCFSDTDFAELDIKVEESQQVIPETQESEAVSEEKIAKPAVPAANAESIWSNMTENMGQESKMDVTAAEVKYTDSGLPTVKDAAGNDVVRMYWWDAFEDPFKHPGVVYLFGKIQADIGGSGKAAWVSTCLIVRNIEKRVFLLPRQFKLEKGQETDEEVSVADVYKEFTSSVANKYGILEFKSRTATKSYCFEKPGIPIEAEYLEVMYSGAKENLPQDLNGNTFSHAFGTNTSSLETFLLHRKIKGPCWLDVKGAVKVTNPVSWCKLEMTLDDMDDISVCFEKKSAPPLVALTLNLKITVNPKTMHNEIVMASCLVSSSYPVDQPPPQPAFQSHFCIVTKPSEGKWPFDYNATLGKTSNFKSTTLHKVDSERALLSLLLTLIFKTDPDLLVGHDIANFDLPTLLTRISILKVENWSRLGRLKRASKMDGFGNKSYQAKVAVSGRLVCDVKLSSQELIKSRSYDLDTLCVNILKIPESQRTIYTVEDIRNSYSTGASLRSLICSSMQDAAFILKIMTEINAIPLALQITNIAGNVMSRTLMGGRSERNEFLLLHAFNERGYIVPDKVYGKKPVAANEDDEEGGAGGSKKGRRKKAAYSGGLVLEPKKGFYDSYILLMDFNSLYPSIIQEYNICFTTLLMNQITLKAPKPKKETNDDDDEDEEDGDGLDELLACLTSAQSAAAGVLPTEIKKLVDSRRSVKGILAKGVSKPEERMQLNIRQMALKLTANSMYGCLGFSNSRFYAKHLAALVTAKGRDILMNTKSLVEKMGLDVVYGDTDSIMINTRSTSFDEVQKLGFKVKAEVNKMYRQLELDVDGIFKYLLLLKKKKYAALTIARLPDGKFKTEQELKGLDIVRRDWAPMAVSTGKYVVDLLLSDMNADERIEKLHDKLSVIRGQLEKGEIPIAQLAIAKTLTRPPEQYSDKKGLPHVVVAMRLNSKGGKKLKQGDTVHYVVCQDGSDLPATQRGYHLDEIKANPALKVDIDYYLAQQVHPVVTRLIECLEGTDAVRVAECLGLDATSYRQALRREEDEDDSYKQISQFCLSEEERFKNCESFKFKCKNPQCGTTIEMRSAFLENVKPPALVLEKCPNPDCAAKPSSSFPYLQNCLSNAIRRHIAKYYEGWMVCEDPRCKFRSKEAGNKLQKGNPVCRKCNQSAMFKEYTEHDLHQQIYFYRYVFNLSKYPNYKRDGKKDAAEGHYLTLKSQVDKAIRLSSYCILDLTDIFKKLQVKKTAMHKSS
ncbi:Hypothetical predicted protein [Cloeon dipterum]|uniref:DNA polymerase n=1 Tax=Cloeon dipterum TaxID=197152 RepID=A0A8S1CW92_9INSE|nr:Hypothetical predicted protein [Cloeon dipterum]